MELPQPPPDTELRNIIDKLAQFVARNGPEFEQMTKNKQKGNPKFQFLYGGEFFNYYQYKVQAEQTAMTKPISADHTPIWQDPPHIVEQLPPVVSTVVVAATIPPVLAIQLAPPPQPPQLIENPEIVQLTAQIDALQEQVIQSEQNLQAQQTVLLQQQQVQSEQMLIDSAHASTLALATAASLNLTELDGLLVPIVENCTKDSVQAGKHWILQHATNNPSGTAAAQAIAQALLQKVMRQSASPPFTHMLHVIYLVNDVLHHCARKNAADIKDAFESVVVPMFCSATLAANSDEQRTKLNKLLELWKSKANYLSSATVEAMRRPQESLQQHKAALLTKYTAEITAIVQQTQVTFEGYSSQHQAYVAHATNQITELEKRKNVLVEDQQKQHQVLMVAHAAALALYQQQKLQIQQQLQQQQTVTEALQPKQPPLPQQQPPPPSTDISLLSSLPPQLNLPPNMQANIPPPPHFHNPPPNFFPPPGMFPDFSRPPPGFPPVDGGVAGMPPQPMIGATPSSAVPLPPSSLIIDSANSQAQQSELFPSVPYYELPAGLMVPLIKLADMKFVPLDPADIRLPPPAPPSERLLAAVEAFYAPPSHERPRDSEGWEKLGLYEYYKAKHNARKERDEQVTSGVREASRSPSPIVIPMEEQRTPSPPRRRYTSPSPSANRDRDYPSSNRDYAAVSGASTRSARRSRSRSISRSPPPSMGSGGSDGGGRGGGGRRRDRDRGEREHRRSNRRRRTRSRSRSKSPASTNIFNVTPLPSSGAVTSPESLDASNKGHQMLKRMGWGGSGGLGAHEQGIDAPISGGDVRDKQDQFKGIGCNLNDPYENFRKNKGAAFITRMKARAEERTDVVVKTPTRAAE